MNRPATVLLDTGVLVAALDRRDAHHGWAALQLARARYPLVTCEGVLAEACYHLGSVGVDTTGPLAFVARGALTLEPLRSGDVSVVRTLMAKYHDVPMDFVDACLVALASRLESVVVLTVDSDFFVYRDAGGRAIETIHPSTHAR